MQIFLSYAAEDRQSAEAIQLALVGAGHSVFFDRESLPPGGDYYARIQAAASRADLLVFLVSPHSVAQGSFALTELKHARAKWPHPKGRVVPVMLHPTSWEQIPNYLKSITFLEPEGNVAAEVLMEVDALTKELASAQNSQIPEKSINISGIWRSWTGAEFQIVQSGNTFTFVANDPATGVCAEGSGTINGRSFTSIFRTNIPSTGTGEGMVSDDCRQMTGTFNDSRIGRYTQIFNR